MKISKAKYIKKNLIIAGFIMCISIAFTYSANAQNTELRIIDLSIMATSLLQINESDIPTQADTLQVLFKMNKAELAAKVVVQIGNKEGRKNIVNTEYPVINEGGKYFVNTGQERYEIRGYNTFFEIPVNRSDIKDFFYISIYVEDINGQTTQTLTYKI